MKVIIAGSRDIVDEHTVRIALSNAGYSTQDVSEIVSGGARGVDTVGELIADNHDIPVKRFPAEWNKYGKRAGMIRNKEMARYADALVAIWDGQSKGTKSMIEIMKNMDKYVHVETIKKG